MVRVDRYFGRASANGGPVDGMGEATKVDLLVPWPVLERSVGPAVAADDDLAACVCGQTGDASHPTGPGYDEPGHGSLRTVQK